MNKQAIYHNMTKGQWAITDFHMKEIQIQTTDKGADEFRVAVLPYKQTYGDTKANAEAIISGVNLWTDLMDKGINPEAKVVEDMRETLNEAHAALQACLKEMRYRGARETGFAIERAEIIEEKIIKALEAAKISQRT